MGKNYRTDLQKAKRTTRRKWQRLLEDAESGKLKNIDLFYAGHNWENCGFCNIYCNCGDCLVNRECSILLDKLQELVGNKLGNCIHKAKQVEICKWALTVNRGI